MSPAPALSPVPAVSLPSDGHDLEKEVDRIQETAVRQLTSIQGLNDSLVKKIRKSEAQTAVLLAENKALEDKNAHLVAQLHRTQDDVRTLLLKEARLAEAESKYAEASKAVIAAELAIKKGEGRLDAVTAERDALESEVQTSRLRSEDMERQLKDAVVLSEKEKEQFDTSIEQRSLDFAAVSKEKDEERETRELLESQIEQHKKEVDQIKLDIIALKGERDQAIEDSDVKVKEVEDRLAKAQLDLKEALDQLDTLKLDYQTAVDEKDSLQQMTDDLNSEKEELQKRVGTFEMDLVTVKEDVALLTKEKDEAKTTLDAKEAEALALAAQIETLNDERHLLNQRQEELEATVEENHNNAESTKTELESRNFSVESERNLLVSEKVALEKDYAEARDRATILEREKTTLEKRVYELEEGVKRYTAMIAALEEEKISLTETYEKDLAFRVAEKEAEFAFHSAQLRKEIDDVVDRHTPSLTRERTAASATPSKSDPSVDGAHLDTIESAGVDEMDLGPDVPMIVPDAPLPFVRPDMDLDKGVDDGDDTMVMTREIVEDDFELDNETGPGEGDTLENLADVTTEVITEEVMEEVVVDARDGDDDVLEVVDEEVAVPDDEAAEKRRQGGAKVTFDNEATQIGSAVVENAHNVKDTVTDGAAFTSEKIVDTAFGTTLGAAAGATATMKSVGDMTKDKIVDGAASTRDVAAGATGRAKRAGSSIWKKALCCVTPPDVHGDKTTA